MSQQTQALLDSILTNIDHGIIVSNADNIIVHVNPAFERMTGYGASEVVGKDPEILVSGDLNMAIISTIKKSLNSESSVDLLPKN